MSCLVGEGHAPEIEGNSIHVPIQELRKELNNIALMARYNLMRVSDYGIKLPLAIATTVHSILCDVDTLINQMTLYFI